MENYICDVCGKESEKVVAGRWLFYCSDNAECRQKDFEKTYDNEIAPDIESGDFSYCLANGLGEELI